MDRYAMVEGGNVRNVIAFDPEADRLPTEIEENLVKVPRGVPVEAGWTWGGGFVFEPPLIAPSPRKTTVGESIGDLESQTTVLETLVIDLEAQVVNLQRQITELFARVVELESRP